MESESGAAPSINDELGSSDWQGDQLEGERGVSRSIIDERHSYGYPRRSNGRRTWCYSNYH